MQGYYFSPAIDSETIGRLLARWFWLDAEKKVELSRLCVFEWFAGVDEEDLGKISRLCEEFTVPQDAVIIREGQVGSEVYLMEEGSVGIYREQGGACEVHTVLHAPAVFGELAIIHPERIRTASVKALTSVRLLTIPVTPLVSFLLDCPALRNRLRRFAAERSQARPVKNA